MIFLCFALFRRNQISAKRSKEFGYWGRGTKGLYHCGIDTVSIYRQIPRQSNPRITVI